MGRDMPVDCDRCGGVMDWGDFGPAEDGSVGTTCACDPEPDLVVWLREQIDSERRQRNVKVDLMNGGLAEHDGAIRAYQLVIERLATRMMVITSVVEGRPSCVVEGEDY